MGEGVLPPFLDRGRGEAGTKDLLVVKMVVNGIEKRGVYFTFLGRLCHEPRRTSRKRIHSVVVMANSVQFGVCAICILFPSSRTRLHWGCYFYLHRRLMPPILPASPPTLTGLTALTSQTTSFPSTAEELILETAPGTPS